MSQYMWSSGSGAENAADVLNDIYPKEYLNVFCGV